MTAMFQPLTPAVTAKSVEAESRDGGRGRKRRRGKGRRGGRRDRT